MITTRHIAIKIIKYNQPMVTTCNNHSSDGLCHSNPCSTRSWQTSCLLVSGSFAPASKFELRLGLQPESGGDRAVLPGELDFWTRLSANFGQGESSQPSGDELRRKLSTAEVGPAKPPTLSLLRVFCELCTLVKQQNKNRLWGCHVVDTGYQF